tara:strand:- start:53 stop:244 length:192 start_codon:yes stop_codon:yes gene_type:complete
MNPEIKRLTEARRQWENDIKMYNDFLKTKSQTFEGKYGAKEYIVMAKNRISDINNKLKEIEEE